MKKCAHTQSGVTLVELLITLVVLGITASIAAPAFQNTIKNQRLTTAANEVLTSLALARSTAITMRAPTVMCRTSSATQPTPVCGAGSAWHEGWIVFVDANGNGNFDPAADILVEQHGALPTGVTMASGGNADPRVRFRLLGTAPGFNTTFQICDDRKSKAEHRDSMRQVVLAFSGRGQVREGIGGTACR